AASLDRIDASGGSVTRLEQNPDPQLRYLTFPFFLPDGRRFLTLYGTGEVQRAIELVSLDSAERKMVLENATSAPILAHTPAGKTYLLYLKDATLQAREFDEASGTVRGQAALVVDNIARVGNPAYVPKRANGSARSCRVTSTTTQYREISTIWPSSAIGLSCPTPS